MQAEREPAAATADVQDRPAATVDEQIARIGKADVVVALLTYNNADTIPTVMEAAARGVAESVPEASVALVDVDAKSADATRDLVASGAVPSVVTTHEAPIGERIAVPFHGVPGRARAFRAALGVAQQLHARVVLFLEADVVSVTPAWIERLARPVWEEKADLVVPAYARHRYDGTITNLVISPLVRALYGRRVQQPLGGAQALSLRLAEHLLAHPRADWHGRELPDLWMLGAAIGEGFAVWEAWLGPRVLQSRVRPTDLPAMVAQTVGGVFGVMDRHADLWREARGSEPLPAVGEAVAPGTDPRPVDVDRMLSGFALGLRDLTPVWEHVLAPETLGDVLSLNAADSLRFRFPDELWARIVYDFALGYHYSVIHREHLLRSLVPLYLGRTAAYVLATRDRSAAVSDVAAESVGRAFERQKPYLVERWT